MPWLRLIAIVLSVIIHGSIGYAMLPAFHQVNSEALDVGEGTDIILVEQGEGSSSISEGTQETVATEEIVPVQQQAPPPPTEEVKPDELQDIITSDASTVVQDIVKTEKPPPPKPEEEKVVEIKETPPPETPTVSPEVVQAQSQPEQVLVFEEHSAGAAQSGGNAKMMGLYLSQINEHVQRAKVDPKSPIAGTVIVRYIVDVDGKLLSKEVAKSSGSKVLDDAATAALDRAAPFPPIPPQVSVKPLAFTQPFKFVMR